MKGTETYTMQRSDGATWVFLPSALADWKAAWEWAQQEADATARRGLQGALHRWFAEEVRGAWVEVDERMPFPGRITGGWQVVGWGGAFLLLHFAGSDPRPDLFRETPTEVRDRSVFGESITLTVSLPEYRIRVFQLPAITAAFVDPTPKDSRFPHTCELCGKPAYVGAYEREHAAGGRACPK